MKLTYWSHSCFLIETGSHRLVIDPFLSGNRLATVKPEDVECDFILLSHGHSDHVGDSVQIARKTGATIISTVEVAGLLKKQGVATHDMNLGGAHEFPFGRVKLTIAHHSSSVTQGDAVVYLGNPAGLLITAGEKTLYHAGDTGLFLDMKLIGDLHRIDAAMLPIGDNYTMGVDDAVLAVEFLRPRLAIPMHYNTFDAIKADPEAFVRKVELTGARAKALKVGEGIEI